MNSKIKVGISACLLGQMVRYDAQVKEDRLLKESFNDVFEWVGICPEVECGLTVPREAMRLLGTKTQYTLLTNNTKIDNTQQLVSWAKNKVKKLEKENLAGFIFKTKSPSCALNDAKVFDEQGQILAKTVGLFAKEFMHNFTLTPVEDDQRLQNSEVREKFIQRVTVFNDWNIFKAENSSIEGFKAFHVLYKDILNNNEIKAELSSVVLEVNSENIDYIFDIYINRLMASLKDEE